MKVRCRFCRDYVEQSEMFRNVGLGWVCTEACYRALNNRSKKTRTPLAAESPKRKAERPLRADVRRQVIERDKGCVGPRKGLPGACGTLPDRYGLEVHESSSRGTHPGSHLNVDLAVALCPVHHDMITSASGEMLELARRCGLVVKPKV